MKDLMKDLIKVTDSNILQYWLNSPGFRYDVVVDMEYKDVKYQAIFQRHDNQGVVGDWYIEENACDLTIIDDMLHDGAFGDDTDISRDDVKDALESYLFGFIMVDINFIRCCDYVLSLLPGDDDWDGYPCHDKLQETIDALKNLSVTATDEFNIKQLQNAIDNIDYFLRKELSELSKEGR